MKDRKKTAAIVQGNAVAHRRDAIGDVFVIEKRERRDNRVYGALYGMSPVNVQRLGK